MTGPTTERRSRSLTDADIDAIAAVVHTGQCASFTPEEVSDIKAIIKPMKDLADVMRETRSVIIKGLVGVILSGMILLLVLGFKAWSKN